MLLNSIRRAAASAACAPLQQRNMKVLVAIKRVIDYNQKIRVKADKCRPPPQPLPATP